VSSHVAATAAVRVVAYGIGYPEGPVVAEVDGRDVIVVVDIEGGRLLSVDQCTGEMKILLSDACGPNGAARVDEDSIVIADNGGVSNSRHRPVQDGRLLRWTSGTPSAELLIGGFVTPNDITYRPATGMAYMTDPGGHPADRKHSTLYQIDLSGDPAAEIVDTEEWFMNGLAFAADGSLIVVDTSGHNLWRYDLDAGSGPTLLCSVGPVRPDGIAVAADGRLFVAGTYGTHSVAVLSAEGQMLAHLETGSQSKPSNCCLTPGTVWVTDSAQGRLIAFDLDVEPLPARSAR
jgi:sugar lactone lactonase YvrE